ncbi:putative T7SS-secreted protein [Streptomyces sp. NPDC059080]|uniref:putative T7SS-secreted protein n=1 Tax=Streptomyces sp. NPDC059080 TaxID=3346718 RepID=UPI003685C870
MGIGDALDALKHGIDSAADTAGKTFDGVKEAAGETVEYATDKTADALHAVGADGAAHAVRSAGDDVADVLGAQVAERQLGETDDPKELIHGDPAKINETVSHLKDFFAAFERVGQGLRKLDAGAWKGKAADRFREEFDTHPKSWLHAADACEAAGKALDAYAETVTWAQRQARSAIARHRRAQDDSEKAYDAYHRKIEAYNSKVDAYHAARADGAATGDAPQEPGEFTDPGEEGRAAARHLLKEARSQRNEAAERARHALAAALEHAPQTPKFTERTALNTADGVVGGGMNLMHAAGGLIKAGAETVNLARTINPIDPYNLSNPIRFLNNTTTTLLGLASSAAHPGRLAKGMLGEGWGSDPYEAGGAFLGNLVGGKGVGAVGKGLLRSGARDAARSAARTAARDGGKLTLRDRARIAWCKTLGNDPIDMATGRMVLPQTDIHLPGSHPLAFTRTFESSYRTGRWFGPTWMSTLDQRLEIDAEGVILIGEEGNLATYPHPAVGVPTLPAEGPQRPLERTPDGDYVLTEPSTGMRWYFTSYTEDLAVLDEISDRRGHHHTFDHDEDGTPTALTHSAGYRLLFTTEGDRVTALHLAGGAPDGGDQLLVRYGYDDAGNLTTVTQSSGLPLRFGYDDAGRITSWTDTNGSSYAYRYDDRDRCTWQSGVDGHLHAHFTWGDADPATGLRINTLRNSHDRITTYQVNDRHQIVAETDPTGATTRTVRDAHHRVLAVTDPLDRTTRIDYDDEGRPTRLTLPDGTTSTTDFDAEGHPTRTTGPDGTTWTHTYDAAGNRTFSTDPTGATTTYAHDGRGHLTAVTDALGHTTRLECDPAGLPLRVTDPLGASTHYVRDAFGRVVSVTDPLGATTRLTWTVEGKLAARTDPTGATETWTYDGEGNRTSHTDAVGRTTRLAYGHFDLLVARTDPDGVRHEFTHDTELRLTQVTNPQGLTWKYAYDAAGRLLSETDFDDRVLTYTHDAAGQLATRTNTLGEVTTYTRDTMGRVTAKDAAGLVTTYAHSPSGALLQAANPDATVTYARDTLSRVTAETVNGRTMTFAYDALGRRTSRTTPSGHTSTYTYDAAGHRTTLTTGGNLLTFTHDAAGNERTRTIGDRLRLDSTWDATGRLTGQSLLRTQKPAPTQAVPGVPGPRGSSGSPGAGAPGSPFDAGRPGGGPRMGGVPGTGGTPETDGVPGMNDVPGIDGVPGAGGIPGTGGAPGTENSPAATLLHHRAYTYRADGHLIVLDDSHSGRRTFDLDRAGRVTAVHATHWTETYAYDESGNQTHATWPDQHPNPTARGDRTYNGTRITRAGAYRYEHDALGRVTLRQKTRLSRKPDTWRFTWNTEDRLTSVVTPEGETWRYLYDPFGRRVAKQRLSQEHGIATEKVHFSWDSLVLAEQSTQINKHAEYVTLTWDNGKNYSPITQFEKKHNESIASENDRPATTQRFFAIGTDPVGTPIMLASSSGEISWIARKTVWGITAWNSNASAHTPLRFLGQYFDLETQLHYNLHRYYDPHICRYLSSDPLGLTPSPNPETYVYNPHAQTDPTGLSACQPKPQRPSLHKQATSGKDEFGNINSGSMEGKNLADKLRRESANSPFTEDGFLTQEALHNSEIIIEGGDIGNPHLVGEKGSPGMFQENGGDISDWAKYTTERHAGPQGDFEVHFYRNYKTGQIILFDYKAKF